jgi:vacuolar protein sorting-associated protein 13A/C
MAVSLENNGLAFALLELTLANVNIMLRNGTMRVSARLGNLSIDDVTEDTVANPAFKKLLAIEGDPTDKETFPGFNSSVHLKAGSLKFTFMEGPVHSLYGWAMKFAQLKAVYDTASQAAVQRASEVTRMHFDVLINTPIVVLPRDGLISGDMLVLRLGEIFAKNRYLGDPNDTSTIDAGLRGISVTSEMIHEDKKEVLKMVDDVTISATVKQAGGEAHRTDPKGADMQVSLQPSYQK